MTRITGTLYEDYYIFLISRSFLPRMRNVSGKSCRENQNTRFVFNNFCFFFENHAVYEVTWKNIAELDGHRCQYNNAHGLCMLDT